jgi:LCP family protein required for cell wall assembly
MRERRAQPRWFRGRRLAGLSVGGWLAVIVAVLVVAGTLGAYVKYRAVWDSIRRVSVTDLGKRPAKYNTALNILVFGSDSRAGLTPQEQVALHVGHDGCGCSDTLMVLHISPGRGEVTILNLPRDTMVPTYQCNAGPGQSGQPDDPGVMVQINQTLQHGGPSCLWKTVEQTTGIYLDHFIELSFTGVVKVVNDVGGVNVCVPFDLNDPNSGLVLDNGEHHIDGLTFLEFWRARYTIGNGSDLERIERDDFLLAQVLKGVLHSGLLSSPPKLLSVVSDAAAAMTTDSGLSASDMLTIARSLHGIASKAVQFIEAPTIPYPPAPAQVELAPQDTQLFRAIAHDATLPKPARTRRPRSPPVLDISPSKVRVQVLNGSGIAGVASQASTALTSRGFDVVGTPSDATTASGTPDYSYTTSVIRYASAADLPAAETLKKELSSATLRKDASLTPGTIDLIIGSSFTALAPQGSSPPSPSGSPSIKGLAHSYGGITGNASCQSDSGAFTG